MKTKREEIIKDNMEAEETKRDHRLTEEQIEVALADLASMSITKQSVSTVTKDQLVFLIDCYYQTQDFRKAVENQLRSISQGVDGEGTKHPLSLSWALANIKNQELQLKKLLDTYTDNNPVCKWAKSICGVGPIIAAGLWAYFDISKANHYNQYWSYAGLNDNNIKWLGKEAAEKITKEAYEYAGLKRTDPISEKCIGFVANKTHREPRNIIRGVENHKKICKKKISDREALASYLAKPPYNKDLKTFCWNIGECFNRQSKKSKSLYGSLIVERKAYEHSRNLNGDYADQAAEILRSKNIQDKRTKTIYEAGMLTDGHILARAKRYAVKMFIAHFFEASYLYTYGCMPKDPYPIEYLGHSDYVGPEVPYEDFIKVPK